MTSQDRREEWSLPEGGLRPVWLRKLMEGDKRFWVVDGDVSDCAGDAIALERRISACSETGAVHGKDAREQTETQLSGADRV